MRMKIMSCNRSFHSSIIDITKSEGKSVFYGHFYCSTQIAGSCGSIDGLNTPPLPRLDLHYLHYLDFLGLKPPPDPKTFAPNNGRDFFHYELIHRSKISNARVGLIHTPHGPVETPGFVAVATNAALKAVDHHMADEAGQQLMFCNTYHLLLQPGPAVVEKAGGIHKFMNRNKPIITDSGGFQVRPFLKCISPPLKSTVRQQS